MDNKTEIDHWIFDLDNTLYPARTNLFAQVDILMRDFIAQFLDIEPDKARGLQKQYFTEHGTTLRGLMTLHDVNPKDFLDFVHDIDLTAIDHSPELKNALDRLDGDKYIFTNASRGHAERVMDKLGVSDCFKDIYDIVDAAYRPKPDRAIYEDFVARFDINPARAVMVEDMARNLKPAAELGMTCVWIETDSDWARAGSDDEFVHHHIPDVLSWLTDTLAGKA